MRRTLIILAIIVVVGVGGYLGYQAYQNKQQVAQGPDPAAQATAEQQANVIWASGKLVPARWAGLSPEAGGRVRAVHVAEGDSVTEGQVLVELDSSVLAGQVAAAEAAVAEAEAARAKLLAGATPAERAAAQAEVTAAEGALAQAQAGQTQAREGVAVAEAQVAIAQAQYAELASGPTQRQKLAALREVELAQAAVKQTQSAYDRIAGDPESGARPEALALEQATLTLKSAQANYDLAAQGATSQQLAVARAQVNAARAQVGVAQAQIPAADAAVKSAEAQVARAEAAAQRVEAGATAEEKAMAEAAVHSAQAAVTTAHAQAEQATIVAPFAGEVGAVYVRPGEQAVPGQTVLVLGDSGVMQVETSDLRETDVARLHPGLSVEVTFDALPGRTFDGKVLRIAPMSNTDKGSTNYTVVVEVLDLDPALRWGMTAFVNIQG